MKKKTLVIIDGHAIIHRAYHALPPMTTKDGQMVNAVYGFASMLLKVRENLKPSHLVVTFDVSKDTFRSEMYTEYKAHREKADDELYEQVPLIKDLLRAANVDIYEKEGYEADDVIGTIATEMESTVDRVIIVTGDKDMLQLVDNDTIEVFLLKKGLSEFILYNEDKMQAAYGFEPIQMIDFKALRGDSSDNIPGIKGIGEKTAKKLIEAFGTIDAMYAAGQVAIEEAVSKRMAEKVIAGEEDARMSYALAKIETGVPDVDFSLEDAALETLNEDGLKGVLRQFEFFSLLKRLGGAAQQRNTKKETKAPINVDVTMVESIDALEKGLVAADTVYIQLAFTSKDMLTANVEGVAIGTKEAVYFVPAGIATEAIKLCTGKTIVGHDLKQCVKYCVHQEVPVDFSLFDLMIASYLVNSSTRSHDLRSIIMRELGVTLPEESKQGNLFGVDPQAVAQDVGYIRELFAQYSPQLDEFHARSVFEDVEMPLIPVLAEMELHGIAVDAEMLQKLSTHVNGEIKNVSDTIWAMAGEEFNISSSSQLRDILFDTLELPTQGIKKGKTGYSTAASELEKLREYHEIIPLIEEYRELEKLRNTYIDVLPTLMHPQTGRIHTSFNQAVAATGRLSSSDPNLQNIPIRTELGREIRDAFVAAPGYKLVAADYSQIELRIVAHLAKDETLLRTFREGRDIHTATAAVIHGIPEEDVTKDIRRTAKEVNFGVLYGMGAYGLASRTGISRAEAKEFIDTYFERFASVKQYLDGIIKFAEKNGYVETLYGRRRYIPEMESTNYQLRTAGERMAINMPVQGTAADIMKLAMVAVYENIQASKDLNKHVRMLLQVHDELVLEVKEGVAEEVAKMLEEEMTKVVDLDVPILVEAHIGERWGQLK